MNVDLQATSPLAIEAPLLAVPVFADDGQPGALFEQIDGHLGGALSSLVKAEGYKAKPGKTLLLHTTDNGAARHLLVGVGKAADLTPQALRAYAGTVMDVANAKHLAAVAVALPASQSIGDAATFATLGVVLGNYRYLACRTKDLEPATVTSATLLHPNAADAAGVVECAVGMANGVMLARDLVNGPPNIATPKLLAHTAERIAAEHNLEIAILKKRAIKKAGMGLLMAVAKGSAEPPRFIHLIYTPDGATDATPSVALVGKGITFDAGGYNIKPTGSMEDMKIDMGGAAAVLGAMKAIRAISPDKVVHGIVPTCENLISDKAYKPGDVITGLRGTTVEIMNTDAEGRLILADALTYADRLGVDRIIDLATLTGACMVALGPHTAGAFGNDDGFRDKVVAASKRAGEDMWPMPLTKKLRPMLDSPIADLKNIGERWGGAITAGLFLSEFVGETTWVHLDIAGPAATSKPEPSVQKGGTGFGVLSLLELLKGEV